VIHSAPGVYGPFVHPPVQTADRLGGVTVSPKKGETDNEIKNKIREEKQSWILTESSRKKPLVISDAFVDRKFSCKVTVKSVATEFAGEQRAKTSIKKV